MGKPNIAIIGATGMVGRKMIEILIERNFPFNNIELFASPSSAGKSIEINNKEYTIKKIDDIDYKNINIALLSAGSEISKKFAPKIAASGGIAIDNSSAFRMENSIPLIVPEVNPDNLKYHSGIIANPNCSTIQSVIPLSILNKKYKLKRIIYSTYQAASGAGKLGIEDLKNKTNNKFPKILANNIIPQVDIFKENGYTNEEMKMINETKKILGNKDIKITATCVRVPVINSHSICINAEFESIINIKEIYSILENSPGIKLYKNDYPTVLEANNQDNVLIGRIREDFSAKNAINFWVVADNLRKGAATNAIQIAELIIKRG